MASVISANNVSKMYVLKHQKQGRYLTLRDTMVEGARNISKKISMRSQGTDETSEEFWALKDVSFNVEQGDRVGIIGRNGAGKSTLLKVLSRITEPTSGSVRLKGRLASLLEVGTGFHPELTGRENIFLNGAILGMSRVEIKSKFDQIVDFAEVEKFLDTPVKRYSSGMYVRLAFSVAAHLEPEILVVDEVLAVGDMQFQKKCLGKMKDVGKDGRTVLFVSHNMAAIAELCQSCILLEKGQLKEYGPAKNVISSFLANQTEECTGHFDLSKPTMRRNSLENSIFKWKHATVLNSQNKVTSSLGLYEPFQLVITGYLEKRVDDLSIGFGVMSAMGFPLFNSHVNKESHNLDMGEGEIVFRIDFDPNFFGPGTYTIDLGANGTGIIDWIPEALTIDIEPVSSDGTRSVRLNYDGVILYPCTWTVEKNQRM